METQVSGFASFFAQADGVGKSIVILLVLMSILTWYVVVARLAALVVTRRRSARYLAQYSAAHSLQALDAHHADEPYSRLTQKGLAALGTPLGAMREDFLTRSLRHMLVEESTRMESGLTLLASVGSTAPFVGLFGTVWGVYHALTNIGLSGQGTLDQVAGPVGEALIMTAAGLAVAIPAVLAYNAFVRGNRVFLARLDAFAHDLCGRLVTRGGV